MSLKGTQPLVYWTRSARRRGGKKSRSFRQLDPQQDFENRSTENAMRRGKRSRRSRREVEGQAKRRRRWSWSWSWCWWDKVGWDGKDGEMRSLGEVAESMEEINVWLPCHNWSSPCLRAHRIHLLLAHTLGMDAHPIPCSSLPPGPAYLYEQGRLQPAIWIP